MSTIFAIEIEDNQGNVYNINDEGFEECEWFAHCFDPAVVFASHPIIGFVPVCSKHQDWIANV